MARQRPRKKNPKQLFTILNRLNQVEEGERERGLIISYAVANSLLGFSSDSGSDSERHHQQVKIVYNGLESAVESCQSEGSQETLFALRPKVEQAIQEYNADPTINIGESELLIQMFEKLSKTYRKNPADRLKRDGIALYHEVMAEGIRTRNIDALLGDYKLLRKKLG
jgi:hypothetical protein